MDRSGQALVTVERNAHGAVVSLNVPEKRNALSPALRAELLAALARLADDSDVRVVVLAAAGPAFCSGMDLHDLARLQTMGAAEHLADARELREFFETVAAFPKPTIAAVHGPAVAGGCGLVMACDFALAVPAATFCFSEVKIGFVPALVGVYLEHLVGPRRCREWLLTARVISAEEAATAGLVNRVVPEAELRAAALALGAELARWSPGALRRTKSLLQAQRNLSLQAALDEAVRVNVEARMSSECLEGVKGFIERHRKKDGVV